MPSAVSLQLQILYFACSLSFFFPAQNRQILVTTVLLWINGLPPNYGEFAKEFKQAGNNSSHGSEHPSNMPAKNCKHKARHVMSNSISNRVIVNDGLKIWHLINTSKIWNRSRRQMSYQFLHDVHFGIADNPQSKNSRVQEATTKEVSSHLCCWFQLIWMLITTNFFPHEQLKMVLHWYRTVEPLNEISRNLRKISAQSTAQHFEMPVYGMRLPFDNCWTSLF